MSGAARSSFAAAGTSPYANLNLNTAGGSKKQGLPRSIGLNAWSERAVRTNAWGSYNQRRMIFCMNQLGGVGANQSQFNIAGKFSRPDGVLRCAPHIYKG